MSFSNPEGHINDKYYNKNSPYYIKDLTQRERVCCYNAEMTVLDGRSPAMNPTTLLYRKLSVMEPQRYYGTKKSGMILTIPLTNFLKKMELLSQKIQI